MKSLATQLQLTLGFCLLLVSGSYAQPFGTWALGNPAPGELLATHCSLLRSDKILVVSGSAYNCCFAWGREETRLYDVATGSWGPAIASPDPYGSTKDAFCSGHAHDDQGNVVFQGGLLGYGSSNGHGIDNSARYDVDNGKFGQIGGATAHWYPTLVAGARSMFIFPGENTDGGIDIQKRAYGNGSWQSTGVNFQNKGTYPRVSLLPNGELFIASPANADRKNYYFDPATNAVALAGNDIVPESDPNTGVHGGDSWHGSGVLLPLQPSQGGYPHMRFALTNGIKNYVKDLAQANPTWQVMGTRPASLGSPVRNFANVTLLPTGQIIVTGGVTDEGNDATGIHQGEVYDPETGNWLLTDPATVTRNYHGVTLLLPDGRLWTASSSKNHTGSNCGGGSSCDKTVPAETERRVEIFTPWYYGRSDRPSITSCPAKISSDGGQYDIEIGGSQGKNVGRVVLMRAGSVTHAFDTDQRLIQLDIVSADTTKVTVKSPYGAAAAPPGDYMVFALRSIATTGFQRWVPSVACWTLVEPQVVRDNVPAAHYQAVFDEITKLGYRPVWVNGFEVGNDHYFNAIFTHTDVAWQARNDMDGAAYQSEFDKWFKQGYRLTQVDSYLVGGQVRYAAIWEKSAGPEWTAYNNVKESDHQARFDKLVKEGYRPVNISAVNIGGTRYFTTLYDKAKVGAFFTLTGMSQDDYQKQFDIEKGKGLHLAYVDAFMENGDARISAIWNQTDAGAWQARNNADAAGFQTDYDNFIGEGYQTRAIAGYADGSSPRFAALWTKK